MTDDELLATWRSLLEQSGISVGDDASAALFDRVRARYDEPHRQYHTLEHVAEVLEHVRSLVATEVPATTAVWWAAWLHDVVYDPQRSDNERESAAWAVELQRELGLSEGLRRETSRLIELTATHQADAEDAAGSLLADADLAILGAAPDRYDRYTVAIRSEYAWLTDEMFRRGRRQVLEGFLERGTIFHTAKARKAWEDKAHENIERELRALNEPGPGDLGRGSGS